MSDYEFELPWSPSVNGMRAVFRNRMITTKKGRDYHKSVQALMSDLNLSDEGIADRVHVSMVLNPPTLRKYDIDNRCKAVFDAISMSGFWLDDEQIDSLSIKKGEKVKDGLIKIRVTLLNQ